MIDSNSYANFDEIKVIKTHLDLTADFNAKSLKGFVDITAEAVKDNPSTIKLDVRSLQVLGAKHNDKALDFKLERDEKVSEALGHALIINLPENISSGKTITIRVEYQTTTECEAIQWLSKEQTAGKEHPYLFTQCQAIHARSLYPCQDTPAVKFPYTGTLRVPKPLVGLMSAIRTGEETQNEHNVFHYEQKLPIPSYLVAIAIGNLKSKEIGPRSAVWCEQEQLEQAAYEFAETETFLQKAEEFLTPYEWGRYDLLCLPPSFPYGGMENPCLTFVTPTLLAGDRSLANVVAHEISHSWSGNLVTNKNWEHFWLNEGFTKYLERVLVARTAGDWKVFDFDALLGYVALEKSVQRYGEEHPYTSLVPNLYGQDPDDSFSSVPYEKGFNFLYYLSQLVGGHEHFEPFLKAYFTEFKYQSITAEDMKQFFLKFFNGKVAQEKLDSIEWDKWWYTTGMPYIKNNFDMTIANQVKDLVEKWVKQGGECASADDIKGWNTRQTSYFLDALVDKTPFEHSMIEKMDSVYNFSSSKNSEIRFRWQTLCLRSNYSKIFPEVVNFLKSQGRMKFTRPLFRDLFHAEGGAELAKKVFNENKDQYHLICTKMVAKDLGM